MKRQLDIESSPELTLRRTVFVAVTHGTHAALLLRSSFLDTLKEVDGEQLRIVILSPNADEEYFLREFGDSIELEVLEPQSTWLFARMTWARRHILLDSHASRSHEIKGQVSRHRSLAQYWFVTGINFLTGKLPWVSSLIRWVDRRLFPDRKYRGIFKRYEPDLLVVASVVHNQAFHLLRRAKLNRVPTLFVVESWDNPTCKVGFFERPEEFTVWNELMRDEMIGLHGFTPEQVHITGAPYHDVYADTGTLCSREELAARYGMNPKLSWIVIAATLSNIYPDFDHFMELLDQAREDGKFGEDVQLLIRPHPQSIAGYSPGPGVEELVRLRSRHSSIFFDIPAVLSQRLPVDLDVRDEQRFVEILTHANVVVGFLSTVTIHAAIVDTPVVEIAFGDYENTLFPTLDRISEFNHIKNVIDTGGVSLVSNHDELANAIRRYLADSSLHREGRRRIVREQCGVIDGESGRRTAEVALEMLGFPRKRASPRLIKA